MNNVPTKVFAVVGLETGLFLGLGVALFHTIRVMYTASKQHAWAGFRSL